MNRRAVFKFRLYTAADTQNSVQALANLTAICRAYLPDQHEIEVVDVFREPQRALADGIHMTPTLIKLAPGPIQRIVGTLSQNQRMLQMLGQEAFAARTRSAGPCRQRRRGIFRIDQGARRCAKQLQSICAGAPRAKPSCASR
jgi:circadian clock protein KaiB